jgi:L-iditol 2-dehydrogenase
MDMHCLVVRRIGDYGLERRPVLPPGPGEILVRVEWAGICRTDLKLIRQGHRDLVLPRIPGEEAVGVIVETGAAAEGLVAGQRVYLYPGLWCGICPACLAGAENLCGQMRIMGFHRDGGFAEYVTVPAQSAIPVPAGLAAELAVFAEPLSCCLNALELGGAGPGRRIGIWGAGPAGTLLHRAALAMGAEPVNIEPDPGRRERINGIAAAGGDSFDLCIVAVGSEPAYREALAALGPRGRLVVFSGLAPGRSERAVDFNTLHYREQGIVGAYGCTWRQGKNALDLIAAGEVAVADLISHRLPLAALEEGLSRVERRECMKILLHPGKEKP